MKNIPVYLLPVVLLLNFSEALLSPESLKQLSEEGSKYITIQLENALNGIRQMKIVMDKTGQEQEITRTLEQTKKNKEDVLKEALEYEKQLSKTREICNETVLAHWEQCKLCLKQRCVKFYAMKCGLGSDMIRLQFENFLDKSLIKKVNALAKVYHIQNMTLEDLEDGYSTVKDIVEMFQDGIKSFHNMRPLFTTPFQKRHIPNWNLFPSQRLGFPSFHTDKERSDVFDSGVEKVLELMERYHRLLERSHSTKDRILCRKLRQYPAGCLKMKDSCEKCKEILEIDCDGKEDLMQETLLEKFQDSVRLAVNLTRQYNDLLQKFREKMLNTTGLLKDLSHDFGWVSKLAQNYKNGILQVSTAPSSSDGDPSETAVTIKLFDRESFTFNIPGNIHMEDPKLGEMVAEEALKRFKAENVKVV